MNVVTVYSVARSAGMLERPAHALADVFFAAAHFQSTLVIERAMDEQTAAGTHGHAEVEDVAKLFVDAGLTPIRTGPLGMNDLKFVLAEASGREELNRHGRG